MVEPNGNEAPEPKKRRGNPNWFKGCPSPNPKGGKKPETKEIQELFRDKLLGVANGMGRTHLDQIMEKLVQDSKDGDHDATRLLLAYGFGKPVETVHNEGQQRLEVSVNIQRQDAWFRDRVN